jgi:hypothetical protein
MANSESEIARPRLDESLWKLRTAILCRLAMRLGLPIDESRIQALVQRYDDAAVWRIIAQSHDGGMWSFRKLFRWRASQ